jgi:hypothetical protein
MYAQRMWRIAPRGFFAQLGELLAHESAGDMGRSFGWCDVDWRLLSESHSRLCGSWSCQGR